MKSKKVVDTGHVTQGICVPDGAEIPAILAEAEQKAAEIVSDLGSSMTKSLENLNDHDRVVMSFAHIVAMAALASVNASFQAQPVQEALHALTHRHTFALRQFFFEQGARDAYVLMEKHGAELMGGGK